MPNALACLECAAQSDAALELTQELYQDAEKASDASNCLLLFSAPFGNPDFAQHSAAEAYTPSLAKSEQEWNILQIAIGKQQHDSNRWLAEEALNGSL